MNSYQNQKIPHLLNRMVYSYFIYYIVIILSIITENNAFMKTSRLIQRTNSLFAVSEVGSTDEFDAAMTAADGAVVCIDYSTTWCGPCKIVLPKFEALSEKYDNVVFLKVSKQ